MPSPYQAGTLARTWVQAKTHGIARSDASDGGWPPPAAARPRAAGREPSRRPAICSIGVAAAKTASKSGSSQTSAR